MTYEKARTISIVAGIMFVLAMYMMFKNENTYRQRKKIRTAIDRFVTDTKQLDTALYMYKHMRSYEITWLRFWDWGYEHILSPELFNIIEPYMRKRG